MAQHLASARLDRICAELEIGPDVARRFVHDYLGLLDERLDRIDAALNPDEAASPDGCDDADAVVTLLGLESSSSMLGAFPVALAARRLRIEVQTGRTGRIEGYRRELGLGAQQVREQLDGI